MGNILSSGSAIGRDAVNVTSESETMNADANSENDNTEEEFHDAANEDEDRAKAKEEEMEKFRKQLNIKREQRREILARHRSEKEDLEKSLKKERASKLVMCQKNEQLLALLLKNNIEIPEYLQSESSELTDAIVQMREEFEKLRVDNNKLRGNLAAANNSLQGAYSDIADLNGQNIESMKQIHALKEVVSVSKTLISLREDQLNELKDKLGEIERSLGEREANMLSVDLRQEYERQLQNIRTLRGLYEERARLAEVTRQGLARDLEEQKALYQTENNRCKELAEKVDAFETKVDMLEEIIQNKNCDISTSRDETNRLKAEMAVVNKLFSQVLLGYKTKKDLDKLVHRLEENHGLLTHMAENEDDAEASSELPKLLLELVSQVDETEESGSENIYQEETTSVAAEQCFSGEPVAGPSTTAEEIVENLPKVWRVLMELLSHQTVQEDSAEKVTTCYKSVETKSGSVLVPSVSQTYIRLKDLIVEKLGLVKEVNRMKQLNSHLESRLQEQEKRLCLVTTELSKTWHVVGKLRRHHYQLHTHEKILKYELQQKRKLLNELKEELEYCREKWEQAREKNTQSEKDWRKLRAEFSSRKTKSGSPSFNNSGESGYSDERPSDDSSESNDESEYVAEPFNKCKKKNKKSLENVLDSSADCNLAEREDPVSDLLDVAELPLDTQEGDDHQISSTSSKSDNILKSERTCETEDEIGEMVQEEVLVEDLVIPGKQPISDFDNENNYDIENRESSSPSESTSSSSESQQGTKLVDPATILMNIKKQTERLAKKDERLEKLEKNSTALLKKTQATSKLSNEINSTLDHLINRPTTSNSKHTADIEINQSVIQTPDACEAPAGTNNLHVTDAEPKIEQPTHMKTSEQNKKSNETELISSSVLEDSADSLLEEISQPSTITISETAVMDFKVKHAKKDETLQNLESSCAEVVQNISNTLNNGETIITKLDTLDNEDGSDKQVKQDEMATDFTVESSHALHFEDKDASGPSTSAENNHEARFAARDIRLKRLEEQTKSLVNRVNKTNSKGVKINYKLDELHNIYGSESSRAGTPSEDTEDKSIDEEPKSIDEEPDNNN